jgi:hypothetical protein
LHQHASAGVETTSKQNNFVTQLLLKLVGFDMPLVSIWAIKSLALLDQRATQPTGFYIHGN